MLLLKQPADLFQRLRSSEFPIQERLQLAHSHWSNQHFELPHKQLYFLRWILEADLYHSKSLREAKTKSNPSPVQYPIFWELFSQLVSNINQQDLSAVAGGSGSIFLIRHTLSDWCNLFEDLKLAENVLKSMQAILPTLSQCLSLDTSLAFLILIFEGLVKLQHSISQPAERIILLITDAILPTIELTSNLRKAFNSIFMNANVLSSMLQIVCSDHITVSVKSSVLLIIKTLTLNIESLKKIQANKTTKIEWLEALHTIGKNDNKMTPAAIQIVTHLVSNLIHDMPNLRPQLFNQHSSINVPQSSNTRTVTADSSYLHATRVFILHVLQNSFQVFKNLAESTTTNLPDCTNSLKLIVDLISKFNLYDSGDSIQRETLEEIACYCTGHLSHSSKQIVMNSLQILVNFLSLDYTLVEARLSIILGCLAVPSYDGPHEVEGPVLEFFYGVFDWFSKAKQIPNLFTKWIETIESKLNQHMTPTEILDGPMMTGKLLERFHEEIRLSIPSAQAASIHDMLSSRFQSILQELVLFSSDSNAEVEPSLKKRKISLSHTTSHIQAEASSVAKSTVDHHSANRCEIISSFYELFIIAASRSPIQSRERSRLSQKASSFAGEIMKAILLPTLKNWPKSSPKNRFRKWKQSPEQIILASAFRIVASICQAQGVQVFTELEDLNLSEWLELLQQISKAKKEQIDPKLSFELIHLCLEHTSQALSSRQSIDLTVPRTAYETIFQLLEVYEGDLKNISWNGSVVALTSSQLCCALWYHLTTAYLSDFASSATPEQLNQFSKIVVQFSSQQKCESSLAAKEKGLRFSDVNRMMLNAPTFYECTNLREPFLQNIVAGFTSIVSFEEAAVEKLDANQLEIVNGLFGIVSLVPLSYFTKWTRKQLLNWALKWDGILTTQEETSCLPQLTASDINCKKFLCRLLSDPFYSINPQIMKQAVTSTTNSLSRSVKRTLPESIIQVTEKLNSGIIIKIMKSIKPGEDLESNLRFLNEFCLALAQQVGEVMKRTRKSKMVALRDRLWLSALQSMIDFSKLHLNMGKNPSQLSTIRAEESSFFHQHFRNSLEPILSQFEAAFKETKSKGKLKFSSNPGLIQLGKLYLQLCSLDGSQLRSQNCPIELSSIIKSIDEMSKSLDNPVSLPSSDGCLSQNSEAKEKEERIPECLNLLEELIEVNRGKYSSSNPKSLSKAFQALVVLHIHFGTMMSATKAMTIKELVKSNHNQQEKDLLNFKLRKSFVQSCKNSNLAESCQGLLTILNQINNNISKHLPPDSNGDDQQHHNSQNDTFFRLWVLIDLGFLILFNFPTHRNGGDLLTSYPDLKGFEEEMILTLLKSFKLVDLNHSNDDDRSKLVIRKTFYTWKIELVNQLCVQNINKIDRRSMVEILDTMIELSSLSELENDQALYDGMISVVRDLNQEYLRRMIINNFHLLVKLLTNLMKPRMDLRNYARLISDLTSTNAFIPAFSKHAPFLIVNLVKKITSASSSHSDSINQFIHSGLFSLISTIGKFERNSIGHLILELSSSLGDLQSTNILLHWKKILKDWEDFRYKGVD